MTGWRATIALARATALAATLVLVALALGRPELLVLAAPFAVLTGLGIGQRPRRPLRLDLLSTDRWLHEGQSTRVRLQLDDTREIEQVTMTLAPAPYIAMQPYGGMVSASIRPGDRVADHVSLVVSPRRWGVRMTGQGRAAATSRWGGYRWGPVSLPDVRLTALPETPAFDSTESPNPVGLIGRNRSRRPGDGTEFLSIRPFQPGDRLRRIDWRTTLRTRELHAVGSTAMEDSSVLLLVDAVADVGTSAGVAGTPSSLDATVRAAAALAAHHIRVGDRVSLRVLGSAGLMVPPGAGVRHQRRIQEALARVHPGAPDGYGTGRLNVDAGTVVVVLSSMLTPEVNTMTVSLARRGLTLVAVDTLPAEALPEQAEKDRSPARLAWRMRLLERQVQVHEITAQGIPVVAWRGPGTLDEVLQRLARRAQLPRAVVR